MSYGAIAGMGIGSIMGFMGASSANAANIAAYRSAEAMTNTKRQWLRDRMELQHRQSGIQRVFETLAVEKQRLQAQGRNRASAGYRGVGMSGSVKRRDDIINAVDARRAHQGVGMRAHKRDIDINAQAWAEEFAAVQQLNQFASQLNSSMQDPLMAGVQTGLSMGSAGASIQGAFSSPPPANVVNNYGIHF